MVNEKPLVSINIRTYNSEKTLDETLRSVKEQTYPNIEVLVADGYSEDASVRIAEEYGAMVHFAEKLGDARQLNHEKSSGEYILSLDSDQILEKGVVEACVRRCEKEEYDALSIAEKSVVREGTLLENLIAYDKWVIDQLQDDDLVFGTACPRFFRRDLLKDVRWSRGLSIFDDTILYAELLNKGAKIGYLSEQKILHYEVASWWIFIKKFHRYGKGYLRSLKESPGTIAAHSLPRRGYFSRVAIAKPHFFLGLLLLYAVKTAAAGSGVLVSLISSPYGQES